MASTVQVSRHQEKCTNFQYKKKKIRHGSSREVTKLSLASLEGDTQQSVKKSDYTINTPKESWNTELVFRSLARSQRTRKNGGRIEKECREFERLFVKIRRSEETSKGDGRRWLMTSTRLRIMRT